MNVERLVEYMGSEEPIRDMVTRFPKFAEGVARVGDVVHNDGALPARDKALCTAAIGAVKRLPDVTARYLRIAIDGGLTADEARGAAINIFISRGLPAYRTFMEALAKVSDEPADAGPGFDEEVSTDGILEYYRSVFGDVPPNIALGTEHAPQAIEGYYLMRQAALEESPLEPRLADIVLTAVNASEFREDYVEIHGRFALRGGATAAQLTEAVACSIPIAGVASWLAGATGVIAALDNP